MQKLFSCLLALLVGACGPAADGTTPEAPVEQTATAAAGDVYGAAVADGDALPVATVAADPGAYAGRPIRVEGTIRQVCRQAGCWFTLDGGQERPVRVLVARHDDGSYRFTVPKDLGGRQVVVEGTLVEATRSPEELGHLAADAATGADTTGVKAPAAELQLTAHGVFVRPPGT